MQHYGLEIGDHVSHKITDTFSQLGTVVGFSNTDNNLCRIRLDNSNHVVDAVCEWCTKEEK